ncbi:hypothetical protein JJQ59_25485 [Cupriavidus necator]|uniref:hypothetical protein n=1 Tax=Cupriavidus necator TaxID=106590 RepID=UPI0011BD71A7|nr:hypothetical protein [Cupriavidus necator]QQX88692.1 hypothetical protein JJQ59_25485 [Cupriavidus necator]
MISIETLLQYVTRPVAAASDGYPSTLQGSNAGQRFEALGFVTCRLAYVMVPPGFPILSNGQATFGVRQHHDSNYRCLTSSIRELRTGPRKNAVNKFFSGQGNLKK